MAKAYSLSVKAPLGKWDIPCANYETMKKTMERIGRELLKINEIEEDEIEVLLNDFEKNVLPEITKNDFRKVGYSSKLMKNNVVSIVIIDISRDYN